MPLELKNKRVTVIGAQRSGIAVANLVTNLKGKVKISECGPRQQSEKNLAKLISPQNVEHEWNGHSQPFIEESDLVVLSPGIRLDALPVQWARAKGIPVLGEIELAWQFCSKPVIAVTGSNGKTTVVTLITRFLENGGKRVVLCGNMGIPFSEQVLDLPKKDLVVLEISSFQLESILTFRPHVAVFLNFNQNHLDRHKDLNEYLEAKKRIFFNQTSSDYAVLNYQSAQIRDSSSAISSQVRYFNHPDVVRGASIKNPNYLAAMTVAGILGVEETVCHQAFDSFKGVEHRLEWVRSVAGVDFINDSKSTTAEAGRWAMQSFNRKVIMICGGRDKNIDFSVLRDVVQEKVRKMIVIGESKEKIKRSFSDVVPIEECATLLEAVKTARKNAVAGECVLFSPMCTSFDMFSNFEERGMVFKEIVQQL